MAGVPRHPRWDCMCLQTYLLGLHGSLNVHVWIARVPRRPCWDGRGPKTSLLGLHPSLEVLVGIARVPRRPCWGGRSVLWPGLLWLLTTAALLAQEQPVARKKSICIHCIWQMVVQYVFVFVRVIGNYLLSSDQRWILCIVLKIRQNVEFDRSLQICGSHSMQIHLTWYNFNTWSDSFFFFNFWVIFYHCDRSLLYLTSFLDVTGLLSNDHMYISQTIPLTPPTRKSCQMDFKCNSIS